MSESFDVDCLDSLLKSSQDELNCPKLSKWNGNRSSSTCYANLLQTGFLSDMTICVGEAKEEINVHRLFLQIASPVFHRIFEKHPKLAKMNIPDLDPSTFKTFLQHLYSCSSSNLIDMENALPLLAIASKFGVEELVQTCTKILTEKMSDDNVFKLLQRGMDYGNKDLVDSSLSYISKKAWTILEKQDFLGLSLDCVFEVAQRDDLHVRSEIQLFNALVRWGEAECERKGMEPTDLTTCGDTNLRNELKKLIPLIRFPLMDETEFIKTVLTKEIVSMEEGYAIVLMQKIPFAERFVAKNSSLYIYFKCIGKRILSVHGGTLHGIKGAAKFNAKPREYYKPKVYSIDRLNENSSDWFRRVSQIYEQLNINVNQTVSLIGIQFNEKTFTMYNKTTGKYMSINELDWDMFEAQLIIKQAFLNQEILSEQKVKPFLPKMTDKILLETPTVLQANTGYTIEVKFSGKLIHQSTVLALTEAQFYFCSPDKCAKEERLYVVDGADVPTEVVFSFSRPPTDKMHIDYGLISGVLFTF